MSKIMKATWILLAIVVCLQFATLMILFNNLLREQETKLPCSSEVNPQCEVYVPQE